MSSVARARIVTVLTERTFMSQKQIGFLADQLLPIVRDTVAKGFDTAADYVDRPDPHGRTPAELLRQYAMDARFANHSAEN